MQHESPLIEGERLERALGAARIAGAALAVFLGPLFVNVGTGYIFALAAALVVFGTGYSSLSYLNRLPLDEVKIDRSFVSSMGTDAGATIVRATIDLGHGLGYQVVAEGVEDQRTWDRLAVLGCDMVQGYHVAPPMPADELSKWLQPRVFTVGEVAIAD